MKNILRVSCVLTALCIFLHSCFLFNNDESGSTPANSQNEIKSLFTLSSGGIPLYNSASNTAPSITASRYHSSDRSDTTWGDLSERPTYIIFNALREYDSGSTGFDHTNMYKVLYDAGVFYNNALTEIKNLHTTYVLDTIGDSMVINDTVFNLEGDSLFPVKSPFDFGTGDKAYKYGNEWSALAKIKDRIYALLSWGGTEEDGTSFYGVIESNFNEESGDIVLDVVNLVLYGSGEMYTNRMSLQGNEKTHYFTIRLAIPRAEELKGKATSLIGTGVSKSDGSDDYFLLKVKSNYFKKEIWDGDSVTYIPMFPEGRYYKFNANATEDSLRNYPNWGFSRDSIADPKGYLSILDTLEFFDLHGKDNPSTVNDFYKGKIKLDL